MHLDTAATCAAIGVVSGWFVPQLVARIPEPQPKEPSPKPADPSPKPADPSLKPADPSLVDSEAVSTRDGAAKVATAAKIP